jgi:prepilin-type N-terminal cleavage/methylation domain-containing protein
VTTPRRGRRQAGFTLIELMVSLLVSSLLLVMILSIFARMSFAYREQQQIVNVQHVLAATRAALELDAKQAGLELAQGFTIASDGVGAGAVRHSPIRIVNSSTGPDELGFYYADLGTQAMVTSSGPATVIDVDRADGFTAGALVVLSTPDTTSLANPISPTTDAKIATFRACVVQISTVAATQVTFATSGTWGGVGNAHCAPTTARTTMMFPLVAHYWRIDPTRPELGALQLDTTGNLDPATAAFRDQAFGFTDLQAATYFYDGDAIDTADPDADGDRDWSSSDAQDTLTQPIAVASEFTPPLMVALSLVARTDRNVEGVFTRATPNLIVAGNASNNPIGDRATVTLPSTTDPALMGHRLYRYLSFQVDLRNLGVGR